MVSDAAVTPNHQKRHKVSPANSKIRGGNNDEVDSDIDTVDVLVNLLCWTVSWRDELSGDPAGSGSLLSPDENANERLLFDAELSILNVLSNILNSCGYTELKKSGDEVKRIESISHLLSSLHQQSQSQRGSGLVEAYESVLVSTSNTEHTSHLDVCRLLVSLLRLETKEFFEDIEQTDIYFQGNSGDSQHQQQVPALTNDGTETNPVHVDDSGKLPKSLFNESVMKMMAMFNLCIADTTIDDSVANLPIAELVTSAHLSLTLFMLATSISRTKDAHIRREYEAAFLERLGLPRNSWWLPCRVLKAFVAIQGQVRRFVSH
jgi:hypothetical protein